jgi:hypothetical protein
MDAKDPKPIGDKKSEHYIGRTGPPDEFANPAGVGGEVCDVEAVGQEDEPCDPTEAKDLVLEESKPGYGISGYEGEEVGGG